MPRTEPTAARAARAAERLRKRAMELRERAEALEQTACAIECAVILEDVELVARLLVEARRRGR